LRTTDETVAKDVDGVPYCRVHHCRMIQSSGGKTDNPKTYYKCKVAKCTETARIIKTDGPARRPRSTAGLPALQQGGQATSDLRARPQELDRRDGDLSSAHAADGRASAMAVPQLAAAHFARGRTTSHLPPEEIGAR
jgi:hypothetical protein